MISLVQPLPAGNALRVFIAPPAGAVAWRVLRRIADTFTGEDDAGAFNVAGDITDHVTLDITGLANGTTYFYRAYSRDAAGVWTAGATASGVPAATYQGDTIDPQTLLRDRIGAGLAVEVARGALRPASGKIPVLTAPFALSEGVTLPCVSIHYDGDSTDMRALGEQLYSDVEVDDGGWTETEGWLTRITLNVVGASLNGDERIALRQALQRIILANLAVFDAAGLTLPGFQQRDTEQFAEQSAPIYLTNGSFTCMAPSFVRSTVGEIAEVEAIPSFFAEVANG